MNDFNDFIVVYSAEIVRRIKSRPFQIGLILGLLAIFAFTRMNGLLNSGFNDNNARIVLAGSAALTTPARKALSRDFRIVNVQTSAAAPTVTTLKRLDASLQVAIGRDAKGLDLAIYALKPNSNATGTIVHDLRPLNVALGTGVSASKADQLVNIRSKTRTVSAKFGSSGQAAAAFGVGSALIFFLYLLILINSQIVMSSVAEEKTSRIAELLVASISPAPLLYGKIASAATLGVIQMAIWVAFSLFTGGHPAQGDASLGTGLDMSALLNGTITPTVLISFFVLFVLGFLQFSMMFAGMGSLISRTEDLGSVSLPLALPVIAALLISMGALGAPDAPWAVAISFVPVLSPFVLFARIVMSEVPMWQILISVALNIAAAWAIAVLAGKLYRVGMLLYGRAPSLGQVWHVLRS
ncbi:MAG TPA: ABC transporter permease [Verrucomicrobiae bacterium]|jgi:ABC-2 type transport system permease protein|nr:ABC transporter permease [Verrucomicrobiae bacterium]